MKSSKIRSKFGRSSVQILPKGPKWLFASFYLHLFFGMKKVQKPLWDLDFSSVHLFCTDTLVAGAGFALALLEADRSYSLGASRIASVNR